MRPAGADNFLRWRRSIDEHLELGRITFHEYAMFSWLCTKADPHTGTLRTRWQVLAQQTTLSANHVCKLCGSLKRKGYVRFTAHRGQRGKLVTIAIDKFPLTDGTYTALGPSSGRGPAHLLADLPAHLPAQLDGQNAETTGTWTGGIYRKRKRSTTTLRVRSADAIPASIEAEANHQPAGVSRAHALAAAPDILRETLELFFLKTGRDSLAADELAALDALEQAHTPAVIQRAISTAVARFTGRGQPASAVTLGYIRESLKHFTTRRRSLPPAHPVPARVYPPGVTRMRLTEDRDDRDPFEESAEGPLARSAGDQVRDAP